MVTIDVVRTDHLQTGYPTPGVVRKRAFEAETVVVSETHIEPGIVAAWHHHGDRELYGFVISGRMRLEFGKGGKEHVEVGPGDFFHIPPQLVHRDINPDKQEVLRVTSVVFGPGPAVINVTGPDA